MRRLADVFLILTAVTAVFAFASPRAHAAVGPCTDVQIIGLRGSDQNNADGSPQGPHDMGSPVGPMADAVAEQLSGAATVSFYGVPYKAGGAGVQNVLSHSYFLSKEAGMPILSSYLHQVVAACPNMKLVVMGYSQGAHVAGDQLANEPTSITDHIKAFVMFGDPRFNPQAPYTVGTFDASDHGIAGPRSLSDFSSWRSRVRSFCNQDDPVCQGLTLYRFVHRSAHGASVYIANYEPIVAGSVRHLLGYPFPGGAHTPLDLAFVIDSTGSMGPSIAAVADSAKQIVGTLRDHGADFHVGLVDYKDTNQGDPYGARVDLQMTGDATAFGNAVGALSADGGGDTPEAVYGGIMTAVHNLSWRRVPRKTIIVMGDAAAKDPEPVTGYTRQTVLSAARALDPAIIDPVALGSDPLPDFTALADGSGGQLFQSDGGDISAQILAAVEQAAIPLYVTLTVGTPARPGTPVLFSAAGSYYDDGQITSYDWDFNGDGVTDQSTTASQTTHIYDAAFTGIARVTVTTEDGHHGSVTADVDIRPDAPVAAGAPAALTVAGGADHASLTASWSPPADAGGGTVGGYVVEVDDASGTPTSVTGTDTPTPTSATVTGLAPGQYTVRVAAVTEAGPGAYLARSVTIGPSVVFTGFFAPVKNSPAINAVHAGWAIPVMFRVAGTNGVNAVAGSPQSARVDCAAPAAQVPAPRIANLREGKLYRFGDRYLFLWKTPKRYEGTCRRLTVTLTDGSAHTAVFSFAGKHSPH